ncbi:MAG: hypothetical protein ACK5TP_01400 [bacterium]
MELAHAGLDLVGAEFAEARLGAGWVGLGGTHLDGGGFFLLGLLLGGLTLGLGLGLGFFLAGALLVVLLRRGLGAFGELDLPVAPGAGEDLRAPLAVEDQQVVAGGVDEGAVVGDEDECALEAVLPGLFIGFFQGVFEALG